MAQYRLPDGKIIEVPDNTPPEGLQALQTQLAGLYPDYYQPYEPEPERSVLGGLAQTPKAIPRGFLNTTLLSAIGAAEAVDYGEDSKLTSDLKNLKAYINADPSADVNKAITFQKEILTRASPMAGGLSVLTDYLKGKAGITESLLAPDEDYRGSLYQSVPEGLGSAAAFIGTTAVNPFLGGTLAAGTGIGTQAELQDQARAKGEEISLGQEIKSKVAGAAIGISEILNPLSILKIFKGLRKGDPRAKPYVKLLKDSAKSAGIEGTQEAVAGYLQELVAQGIYDPTLEVGESMADDFTVGAIVGGIVGAGSSAAHHQIQKNQASDYEQSQANELAKQDAEQDEIIKQRVILAEQQGDQIIDPDLVPDPFVGPVPDEIKPEDVEIPVLESFDFVANDDGSVNVIGKETQQSIGIFPNIEEAARAATEKTKQNRNQFVVGSAEQISNINGLAGNGTSSNIARKLYDPLNTLIDAKVLANFDVRVSDKRQQQFKKEKEIAKNEEAGQRKLAIELMENIDTTGLSIEELGQMQQKLTSELANIQTAYPIEGNVVSPESTLGLFWQYADKSGVGAKNFYTVKEAKKLLNKADFNQLMSEKSNIKFKKIEATGELKPVKRDKGKLDVSQKSFDEAFESKNIEVDYNSPAFKYLAETFTGNTNFNSMSVGQKEMLLSHIKSLPRFNNKTKLPNYTPRPYTAEQMNGFYNQFQGNKFTNKDIKLAVKNDITGSDLTPKQIEQFKTDLIDSGRASKTKNRLTMTDDFTIQQARRAESYSNETTDEFKNRLRRTTLLTPEDIEEVVNNDATYKQGVIEANDLLALPSPEPMDKYSNLLDLMKQRLADRNLKDVGFAFDNALKASLNIKQKGDKYFYEPVDLDKSKGKPAALYDKPLNKIVLSIEAVDPDGTMSETELAAKLTNQLDHESIHALVQLGVLKQKEFDILLRDAKRLLPKNFQDKLKASYTGADNKVSEEELNEELVAEFFRISINNPSKLISPKSKTIIDKILNFLTTLGQTIYDAGFNSSRTIIRDIQSGKIGARERDAPRNVQRLRTINEKKYGISRPTSAQLDTSKLSKYSNIPFSREKKENLDNRIANLDRQIYDKENTLRQDSQYIKTATYNKESNKINDLKRERAKLVEERKNLPPDQEPLFSRAPRDESSGHVADYVPAQYGPPAHDLNAMPSEEFSPEGYSTFGANVNYDRLQQFSTLNRNNATEQEKIEEVNFLNKLKEIKGNPNATITMYQAAPQRDLREGDLITPFFSDAQFLVDESKITQEEVRDADRARRRQEQVDKTGAVDLQQERLFNKMEGISDILGRPDDPTPSTIHTYELKAGDIRWDGNNGWSRWGYFPRIKAVEDTPSFSRLNDIELAQLKNFKKDFYQKISEGVQDRVNILQKMKEEQMFGPFTIGRRFITKQFGRERVNEVTEQTNHLNNKNYYRDEFGFSEDDARLLSESKYVPAIKYKIVNAPPPVDEDSAQIGDEGTMLLPLMFKFIENDPDYVQFLDGPKSLVEDQISFSRINSKELYDDFRRETNNPKTFEQTAEEFKEYKESLPSTMMPRWNEAASPIAIRAGFDYQEGIEPVVMTDAPSYSRSDKEIPDKYKDIDETINGDNNTPDETFADTLINIAETAEEVGGYLSRMRSRVIDEFNIQEKTVLKIGKASAKVRELQSRAISGAIQALRMSKKARGIVSQMMMRGVPVLVDEQGNPVPKNVQGFGGTKVVDFKHGGFVQIIGQLHTTEFGVDLMRLYKMYSIGVRGTRLNEEGKEVVLTPEQLQLAKEIEIDFPIIKKVYDEYQEYNNAILDYAVQTGILSEEITINQLIENITSTTKKIKKKQLEKLRNEARENGFTDEQFRQELLTLANDTNLNLPEGKKIDIRGTAEIWRNNSDYYPFYRKMADDTIQGPAVAGGFLSGNPLGIEIKGSKKAIEPEPLEVMARNMQSIISAAMKNEGLSRLMAVYKEGGLAKTILPKDQKEARNMGSDVISVFENGERIYYQVADPIFTYGLQAMGMTQDASGFMQAIGVPSNILREAITREPGFIIKNMLRDTLSASVTSGADFIPIVDTFKGFAADLSELERFGVIGGYDAANDRQDIVKKINKIKREQGLDVYDEEGNFAINQVVRLWDAAGGLTTRSDGATRKAVADSILQLTGDQVEAAYQGLEIINFDRRGFDPIVRIVTTAIPFLNARFQGLDVLYRSGTGQYSSKISDIVQKTTPDEQAKSIILTHAFRGGLLMLATGLYYALMGDEERYKEERQSVRDDNWLIPMPFGLPPLKFPIPFEVGFIYKTIPERIVDYSMTELDDPNYGNTTGKQLEESITRGITTTLKLDPFAWQLIKPIKEVMSNKSSFTGNPIVPPFMEAGLEPQFQSTINTSSFAIALGKATNTSPIKIDYILKGYTGTIGTYVLNMADTGVRQATGREYVAPYLTQLPIAKSLFASPIGGGLQEQFYEMRTYSNMVTQTINKLEKEGRKDELIAFMQSHKGAISTRDEVLRIDRFMEKYRKDKLAIQIDKRLSAKQKQEIIERLDRDRNLRLAIVPFLVKQTDQSAYLSGLIRN
tara:strand:- start:5698 stop:13365 length:7668 start_codon:yes stop_codon:yes gene_type:complete